MGGDADRPDDGAWSLEVAASEPIEIVFDGAEATDPRPDESSQTPRRRRAAVVAVVSLVAVGGLIVAANGSNEDAGAPDEPIATDDTAATTLPSLPNVATTDGREPVEGQREPFPGETVIRTQEFSALPRGWRAGTVDIPASVAHVGPATVVVLTAQGVLREVDLPSGNTRDLALGDSTDFFGPSIVVGRSSTLVTTPSERANPAGQPFSLLRAGEPAVEVVVPLQASEIRERPSTDEFVGLGVDLAASSLERLTIGDDGTMSTRPIGFGPELSRDLLRYTPTGDIIVSDGGAVFARDEGGVTTLVAEGDLVAASSHHVLTRNCTELYVCDGVLIEGVSGARSAVRLDPEFVPSLADGSAQVSPDGAWLRYRATDLERNDRVLDLRTGDVAALLAGTSTNGSNDVWVPDSSGFFRLRNQVLEFYDVASGEITSFVDALGSVSDFGVRLDATGTPDPPVITNTAIDLRLVAIDEHGSFYDLDLTTGDVLTFPNNQPRTMYGRSIVMSEGSSAYAVAAGRGPSARLDRNVGTSEELDDLHDRTVYRGPMNNTIWRPVVGGADPDDDIGSDGYVLVDLADRSELAGVSVPDGMAIVGGDESGGLVGVRRSGAVSLLRSDSTELLTSTGELLGIGATTVIVRECNIDGECGEVRIDRVSGVRSPADPPAIAVAQPAIANGAGAIVENTVSPDGEVLIGATSDGPLHWIVTDLASKTLIDVNSIRTGSRVAWTADSSHAIFQSGDALFVFDRAAGRIAELADAPPIVGFAVR